MRLVMVVVLAGLVALPVGVSAQDAEEAANTEANVEEPAPSSEPALEQPALVLKWDDAGVEVASPPPRTPDGYTLEEIELRVKRAKTGLGVSVGIYALAAVLVFGGVACANNAPPDGFTPPSSCYALIGAGIGLGSGALIGIIISGVRLARHKRDRNWLRQAHYGTPRRVQGDPAQSRFVF